MTGQATAGTKPPLDEVMLAMDVVDTLRHRRKLVERELSEDGRDEALKARLRKIYAAQGIEVPDHVLDEGVAALKEDRFVYRPPRESLPIKLARVYIARGQWGKWVLGTLATVIIGFTAYYALVIRPHAALPDKLETMHSEIIQSARAKGALTTADDLYANGQSALREDNTDQAKAALSALSELRDRLEQAYTLEIVSRQGELSGIWRTTGNSGTRNYYIIVEARDASGQPVQVAIANEEDGAVSQVSQWGVRVDERVYQQIVRDKQDDGIIQGKHFGTKRSGYLEPEYQYPTRSGSITEW